MRAQEQPTIACLKVMPPPPRSTPETKSKKKRLEDERREMTPCNIVAKNEIAAILSPIVAVVGRRLKSFWKEELLMSLARNSVRWDSQRLSS